jgi:hypothetical protein
MVPEMIRTQVQLTESQAESLKLESARTGLSVAEIIRRALEQTVSPVGASDEERRQRAIAAVGRFHGGGANLSEDHDDYFVEAITAPAEAPA